MGKLKVDFITKFAIKLAVGMIRFGVIVDIRLTKVGSLPHLFGRLQRPQISSRSQMQRFMFNEIVSRDMVSPWKGVVRFGKKGKLAPRYVGPFEIVERVGPVAYRLKLPQELSCVHDTFHVSNLKKCLAEPMFKCLVRIEIDENLRFVEEPIEIVERDVIKINQRRIPLVKVRWNSRQGAEYT
ncbi:hypothetical protein Tco_0640698 [Tanacetum coccineum]